VRFLQEIGAEETVVCRGEYQYFHNETPSGEVESWLVTRLPDGSELVRSDMKCRQPRKSLLTHLQRGAKGVPEFLRLRYRHEEVVAAAEYTFDKAGVKVERQTKGLHRRRETVDTATGYQVDYQAAVGFDYIWRGYPRHARGKSWSIPVFRPSLDADEEEILSGHSSRLSVQPAAADSIRTPAGVFKVGHHFKISTPDGLEILAWYGQAGMLLRWYDSANARDILLVRYEQSGQQG
jgi:hypothetical protein